MSECSAYLAAGNTVPYFLWFLISLEEDVQHYWLLSLVWRGRTGGMVLWLHFWSRLSGQAALTPHVTRAFFCHFPGELPCVSCWLVGSAGAWCGTKAQQRCDALHSPPRDVCWPPVSSADLQVSWGVGVAAGSGSLGGCYYQGASCKCLWCNCWCSGPEGRLPQVPPVSSAEQFYIWFLGLWEVVLPTKMCSL